MSRINETERYSRQADLVPIEKASQCKITVIGTGAIGRQVAIQLAAMGMQSIQLIDFDSVETGNLAAQGFLETDLGLPKVEAVSKLCKEINSSIILDATNGRFRRNMEIGNVVFCCVDSIDTRKFIFDSIKNKVDLFIDGRMSAEVMRLVLAFDNQSKEAYANTLFEATEAYTGSCTAKTTIYSSNVVAGMMVAQFAKWLRNMPLDKDVFVNLLTNEIDVSDQQSENSGW